MRQNQDIHWKIYKRILHNYSAVCKYLDSEMFFIVLGLLQHMAFQVKQKLVKCWLSALRMFAFTLIEECWNHNLSYAWEVLNRPTRWGQKQHQIEAESQHTVSFQIKCATKLPQYLWAKVYVHTHLVSSLAGPLYLMVVSLCACGTSAWALPQEMKSAAVTCSCRTLTGIAKHRLCHLYTTSQDRQRLCVLLVKMFRSNSTKETGETLIEMWYLGTESSPLVLFSGLQRSVTTALRPDSQDEVASKDLTDKYAESKREP